jgi:hypothetical protein
VSAACLGFTDGRRVVAISNDKRVVTFDAATGRKIR